MSVGIHRLSLLLGILGACFGTLGAVVEGGAVYSRSQAWNSYDDKQAAYEALVAKQTEVIAAWEAASEHVTKDGDHKFVKAESSEIFR